MPSKKKSKITRGPRRGKKVKGKLEPVVAEQLRQSVISDATRAAKAEVQQEIVAAVQTIMHRKIDRAVLEHEIMMGVVGLDWNRWPKEKLDVIKAAFAIDGFIESGNTRRIVPVESPTLDQGEENIYMRVLPKAAATLEASPKPSESAKPLFPESRQLSAPTGVPLPPIGESIDEPPATKPAGRIPIIEIGG